MPTPAFTPPTAQELAKNLERYPSKEAVEAAGYEFAGRIPQLGDDAVGFSRGTYRHGVITKVGKTNATLTYVSEGGLAEGQRIVDHNAARRTPAGFAKELKQVEATWRSNHAYHTDVANLTDEEFKAKHGYPRGGASWSAHPHETAEEAKTRANTERDLESRKVANTPIEQYIQQGRDMHLAALEASKNKTAHDYAGITNKTVSIKDLGLKPGKV